MPLTSEENPLRLSKKGKKALRFLLKVGKDYLTHIHETTAVYASRGALHNLFHRLLVNNILVGEWIHGKRYYAFRFADPDVFSFLHHSFEPPRVWRGIVSWLLTRHASNMSPELVQRYSKAFIEHFQEELVVEEAAVTTLFRTCSPVVGDQVPLCQSSRLSDVRRDLYFLRLLLCASVIYVHVRYLKRKEGLLEADELKLNEGERWKDKVTSLGKTLKDEEKYRQLLTNSDMQANMQEFEEKTHLKRVKKTILPSVTRLEKRFVAACETCYKRLSASLSFLLNLLDQI
ncbi:MAG: hypothetical protein GWO20_19725 [Candidatus Korarchaeota archaeon]|nr:hypothetical protein [Candidatus Korarchaeota archaeon]NIU82241.1 hypothetical protein [Candidatus Thorarchaeota archaeon]NIW15582.1 hypothetical protein [Candidatus Thorarchaeota archaeon]